MTATWDLNADLGEGDAAMDDALLDVVTSANVACGGHAGDDATMARICEMAASRGIAIGAQVSYVDRDGFGRRRLDVPPRQLAEQIRSQYQSLVRHAQAAGSEVTYVKPHGALYHAAVSDREIAEIILSTTDGLPVLTLPYGALREGAQERGVIAHVEAFVDRGYTSDGSLVPRDHPDALLASTDAVTARIDRLLADGIIVAIDGSPIAIAAQSICVHSDTPGADVLAARVRAYIEGSGARLAPFAPPGPGAR